MPSKSTCPLDSLTWPSHLVPLKLTLDLELWIELYSLLSSSRRPLLGSTSESTWLVPERTEYQPSLSSPNPWSSLRLTRCCLVSSLGLYPPLIGSKRPCKFGTPRLETWAQHTNWSWSPTVIKPYSWSSGSQQPLSPFRDSLPLSTLGWVEEEILYLTHSSSSSTLYLLICLIFP